VLRLVVVPVGLLLYGLFTFAVVVRYYSLHGWLVICTRCCTRSRLRSCVTVATAHILRFGWFVYTRCCYVATVTGWTVTGLHVVTRYTFTLVVALFTFTVVTHGWFLWLFATPAFTVICYGYGCSRLLVTFTRTRLYTYVVAVALFTFVTTFGCYGYCSRLVVHLRCGYIYVVTFCGCYICCCTFTRCILVVPVWFVVIYSLLVVGLIYVTLGCAVAGWLPLVGRLLRLRLRWLRCWLLLLPVVLPG